MYIIIAILIFSFLILTHELGHFLTAKLFGVRVNEFAIFMGPALLQKTVGETTYSLRCIPIGGFCAMEGEDENSDDPRAFTSARPWKRVLILIAGALMNFITGVLILIVLTAVLYQNLDYISTMTVGGFYEGCLWQEAGMEEGDRIYRINGERVYVSSDIDMLADRSTAGYCDITVKRDGKLVTLSDVPMEKQLFEVNGRQAYLYGIQLRMETKNVFAILKYSWFSALDYVRIVRLGLQDLVSGLVPVDEMSGPVGIVSYIAETGSSAESSSVAALSITNLAALIALNLAVMNMLPIPALDGGRVFFLIVTVILEKLLRRKINPKYEGYIHAAGMILLLAFIAFITFKDIWKLIIR